MQHVISNEVNLETGFYKTIDVEQKVRATAQQHKNCYFLTAFSSVRESYNGKSGVDWYGTQLEDQDGYPRVEDLDMIQKRSFQNTILIKRDAGDQVSESKIANFTFIFGTEEGTGIRVDANQAKNLTSFMSSNFSPTTG